MDQCRADEMKRERGVKKTSGGGRWVGATFQVVRGGEERRFSSCSTDHASSACH